MRTFFRAAASLRGAIAILSGTLTTPVAAQVRYDVPTGRVEVLGLERWTRRMLEDSIAHYAPGQTLQSAGCMATMRYQLKFRDALVRRYRGYDGPTSTREFLSIRLVEPGNRTVGQWRSISTDPFQSLLPEYAPLIVPVTDSVGNVYTQRILNGLYTRDSITRQRILTRADSSTRQDYLRASEFLLAHQSERERSRAMWALDSSSVFSNRIVAALVLSEFPTKNSSWHALVRALRDPHESVRGAASTALARMPRRSVDWAPAQADLRALLGGTNVGEMESVMDLLVETQVSPDLARALLRGNDVWILRLLTSEAPMSSRQVRAFLVAMNRGKDLGAAPAAWHTWMASR